MGHIESGNVQRRRTYKTGSIAKRGAGLYRLVVVLKGDPTPSALDTQASRLAVCGLVGRAFRAVPHAARRLTRTGAT